MKHLHRALVSAVLISMIAPVSAAAFEPAHGIPTPPRVRQPSTATPKTSLPKTAQSSARQPKAAQPMAAQPRSAEARMAHPMAAQPLHRRPSPSSTEHPEGAVHPPSPSAPSVGRNQTRVVPGKDMTTQLSTHFGWGEAVSRKGSPLWKRGTQAAFGRGENTVTTTFADGTKIKVDTVTYGRNTRGAT